MRIAPINLDVTFIIALMGFAFAAEEQKVPLKTEIPPPLCGSWIAPLPPPMPVEPELRSRRPDFLIPAGCTNIALGRKVTASVKQPKDGNLEQITDGQKSFLEGFCVDLGPGRQWIQIDLAGPPEIFAVLVWRTEMPKRLYHAVVVQVSDDAKFKKGVTTIFNGDYLNAQGFGAGKNLCFIQNYQGQLIDVKGAKGRYMRLYSYGNTYDDKNDYIEVEVWGRPAK